MIALWVLWKYSLAPILHCGGIAWALLENGDKKTNEGRQSQARQGKATAIAQEIV
jgi:hypothetical protein